MKTKSLLAILATSLFVFSCSDDDPAAVSRNKGKKDKDKKEKVEVQGEKQSPSLEILSNNGMGMNYDVLVKIPRQSDNTKVWSFEGNLSSDQNGWKDFAGQTVAAGLSLSGVNTKDEYAKDAFVAHLGSNMDVVLVGVYDPALKDEGGNMVLSTYIFSRDLAQGIDFNFACQAEEAQTMGEIRSTLEELMEFTDSKSFTKIAKAYCEAYLPNLGLPVPNEPSHEDTSIVDGIVSDREAAEQRRREEIAKAALSSIDPSLANSKKLAADARINQALDKGHGTSDYRDLSNQEETNTADMTIFPNY